VADTTLQMIEDNIRRREFDILCRDFLASTAEAAVAICRGVAALQGTAVYVEASRLVDAIYDLVEDPA